MISSIFNYVGNKIRLPNEPTTIEMPAPSIPQLNRKIVDKELRELVDKRFISIPYDLIKLISEYFLNFTFDDCFCPSDWQTYFGTRSITLPEKNYDAVKSRYEEDINTFLSQPSPFTPTLQLGVTDFLFYVPFRINQKTLNFCDFCKLTDNVYRKIGRNIHFNQYAPKLLPIDSPCFFGWFLINKNTQKESEHFNKETNKYKQYVNPDAYVAAIAAVTYFLKYKKNLTKEPMAVAAPDIDSSNMSIGCFQENAPPANKGTGRRIYI